MLRKIKDKLIAFFKMLCREAAMAAISVIVTIGIMSIISV